MNHRRKVASVVLAVMLGGVLLTAGSCSEPDKEGAQQTGQRLTEQTFKNQQAAVPYPSSQLRDSLERKNLARRLLITNKANKIGYVYVVSFGKVLGYYTIEGKVSSTQSQMTTSTIVERHGDARGGNLAYEAPGDDGSYGLNEDGIFFFTTEGAFVTTNLDYMYVDQPLPFDVPELSKK